MRQASRELDAEVAEKVMGIRVDFTDWACGVDPSGGSYEAALDRRNTERYGWYSEKGPVTLETGFAEPIPFYSRDIAAAWQVVEKLKAQRYIVGVGTLDNGKWEVCIPIDRGMMRGESEAAPLAICLAALEAVKK